MAWHNSDGLNVKFGRELGKAGAGGEYVTTGPQRMVEVTIELTDLGTAAAIVSDAIWLPAGVRPEKIEIVTKTAATSGGSAVLNVGLQKKDRSTEIDYDGLVAAAAIATFNAVGETVTITAGTTAAGALLGTDTTFVGYITADYDTAAFTAGVIQVRIYWNEPTSQADA